MVKDVGYHQVHYNLIISFIFISLLNLSILMGIRFLTTEVDAKPSGAMAAIYAKYKNKVINI